jgi:hypothetical protein
MAAYPSSTTRALATHMATERAVAELAEMCLQLWLPSTEGAVLRASAVELPPDATAVADTQHQWDYLVDTVLIYGIGIVMAHTISDAFSVLTGGVLASGDAAAGLLRFDMPGLPSLDSLQARARAVIDKRLHIDSAAVHEQAARTPQITAAVRTFTEGILGRITDVVGRAHGLVTKAPDRAAARDVLAVSEWAGVADEIGRTQSTPVLNAGVSAAGALAVAAGHDLEQSWHAILDTHTRPAHTEADGQRQPFGHTFIVGGEQLRFPGDPRGSIENTANCRCHMFVSTTGDASLIAASPDGTMAAMGMGMYRSFTSTLAVIGVPTDDGRMFAPDIRLSFRDFPLPLLWQKQTDEGHFNSFTVGVIEGAHIEGADLVGDGYLLDTPEADEAATQIEHGVTGPSVDLGDVTWELRDASGSVITEDELWDLPMDAKLTQVVMTAKLLAATLVSTPAFGQTSIHIGDLVSKGADIAMLVASASAARFDVPVYPAAYFTDPGFAGPTLPHITASGRIQGHLAAWNTCHTGIQDRCVMAPHSATDYGWFHTSPPVRTDDDKSAKVGRLTVGGGHAAAALGVGPAVAHYDDTGTCFALVHIGEDAHGIWFSGVPAPGATDAQIESGISAPLSGDWRLVAGNLELVAALAVNTPGFPIVASGATDANDRPLSLVASLGPCRESTAGAQLSESSMRGFARVILSELRAEESRGARARALIGAYNRKTARALIAKIDGGS